MPEPVLYIRGFPQPPLEHSAARESLIEDLKAVVDLSEESVRQLRDHLTEAGGFLGPKSLLKTIREVVEDSNKAQALRRIIRNIGVSDIERVHVIFQEESKKQKPPFNNTQFEHLAKLLKLLIQPYPALERFRKAKRLAEVTGQQLETIEFICDLRPIFEESRKNIEGMMPYTRLHIVATGEDGLPKSFEVELTHQQIIDLAEKAEKAKSKLYSLRQSIKKWLPEGLPDLPLTRIPEKEPSDA